MKTRATSRHPVLPAPHDLSPRGETGADRHHQELRVNGPHPGSSSAPPEVHWNTVSCTPTEPAAAAVHRRFWPPPSVSARERTWFESFEELEVEDILSNYSVVKEGGSCLKSM
jgi:hypothetical protein